MRLIAVLAGLCCLAPAVALAHARLAWPPPRNDNSGIKLGPCGGVPPAATRTKLVAGATVEIRFEETVNHPGWFRLALGSGDDQGFDDAVIADRIPHSDQGLATYANPRPYTTSITVPSTPCASCTLQLIQVMTDKPQVNGDYQKYFSCADVEVLPAGSTGDPPPAPAGDEGGCRCTPVRAPPITAWVPLALIGCLLLRRR